MGAVTASTKLLIAFHVMSAYPILMTVMTTEIEENLGWHDHKTEAGQPLLAGMEEEDILQSQSHMNTNTSSRHTRAGGSCSFLKRATLRTFLVAMTVIIAVYCPFFGLLMELVGALCLTMMVFVLPVIFSYKLWGNNMTLLQKVFGMCIVAVGTIGGTIGTVQALQDIAESLAAGKHE